MIILGIQVEIDSVFQNVEENCGVPFKTEDHKKTLKNNPPFILLENTYEGGVLYVENVHEHCKTPPVNDIEFYKKYSDVRGGGFWRIKYKQP